MPEPLQMQRRDKIAPAPGYAPPPASKSVVREYAEAFGVAIILALIIRTFFIQAYKIPSGSMEPTLLIGDHILVNKLIYGLRMPDSILGVQVPGLPYGRYLLHLEPIHHGDVVVFVFPPDRTKDFIKRVIGLPGDTIQIKNGHPWVNGKPMDDPHGHFEVPDQERSAVSPRDNSPEMQVPPGKVFVMGDNRDRSYDSRFWGLADENNVEGRAMIIYWSWDSEDGGLIPIRWSRFGMIVH